MFFNVFFFFFPYPPSCLCTKNVTTYHSNSRRLTKYLCVDGIGQCRTCRGSSGLQTCFQCPRRVITSEQIFVVHSDILTRAHNEMTKGDANRRSGRKQAHGYACLSPSFPRLVYSIPVPYGWTNVELCDHGSFQWIWLTSCIVGCRDGWLLFFLVLVEWF